MLPARHRAGRPSCAPPARPDGAYLQRRALSGVPRSGRQVVRKLLPHFIRHDRLQRRTRQFDGQIHPAPVITVHDRAMRSLGSSSQKAGNFFDRLLRRRQANALHGTLCQSGKSLDAERQMRSAAIVNDRVDFIHDDRANGGEKSCRTPTSTAGKATPGWSPGCAAACARSIVASRPACLRSNLRADIYVSAGFCNESRMAANGSSRFLWISLLSAFSGET